MTTEIFKSGFKLSKNTHISPSRVGYGEKFDDVTLHSVFL